MGDLDMSGWCKDTKHGACTGSLRNSTGYPDPIRGFNFDRWQQQQKLRDRIRNTTQRIRELARKRKQARNKLGRLS